MLMTVSCGKTGKGSNPGGEKPVALTTGSMETTKAEETTVAPETTLPAEESTETKGEASKSDVSVIALTRATDELSRKWSDVYMAILNLVLTNRSGFNVKGDPWYQMVRIPGAKYPLLITGYEQEGKIETTEFFSYDGKTLYSLGRFDGELKADLKKMTFSVQSGDKTRILAFYNNRLLDLQGNAPGAVFKVVPTLSLVDPIVTVETLENGIPIS